MGAVWVSWLELVDTVGEQAARTLCSERGGGAVYVPKQASAGCVLAPLLDDKALSALCATFGGLCISLPSRRRKYSRDTVLACLQEGSKPQEAARRAGVSERYARMVKRQVSRQRGC
jgi:hypothetical protein